MGRPWVWREYDEEGLRFTLLLAQHELRDLAVRLESLRARKGPPQSQTERILGQYHLAYRDLAGVLAGLRDDDLDRVPAVGEWLVREVLEHMLGAEYGFLGVVQYALSPDRPRDAEEAEEGWDSWRVERGCRAQRASRGGGLTGRVELAAVRELARDRRDHIACLLEPAGFDDARPVRVHVEDEVREADEHRRHAPAREARLIAPPAAGRLVRDPETRRRVAHFSLQVGRFV